METFTKPVVGHRVIVRGTSSGVFFGTLESLDGTVAVLSSAQRIWSWEGALDTLTISAIGITGGKLSPAVDSVLILDAREIVRASDTAIASIGAVLPWRR